MSKIQAGRKLWQRLFGGKKGSGTRPVQQRRGGKGGLLSGGLMGAGGFGLGGLLGGLAGGRGQMGDVVDGDGGDLPPMTMAMGASGNNMVSAGSATSVLSDADSDDPVVRQLQDVERVLQAIKGDTSQLVSGIGFNNKPEAANQEALRGMFGGSGRNSELGGLGKGLAALGAGLLALNSLPFMGEDEDEQTAKRDIDPGTQKRFDATAGDELIELAETAGLKGAGKLGAKLGGEALEAIPDKPPRPIKPNPDAAPKPRPTSVNPNTGKSTILDSSGNPMERTPPKPDAPDTGAKKARDAAAESLKKMGGAGADVLKRTPAMAGKLLAAVAKRGGQSAAKLLPGLGKGMNLWLGFEKLRAGDYVGVVGEAAGLIPFIGIPADFANTTRDIYKDVYDVFPEDEEDVDIVAKRMSEIGMMLTKYIADLVGSGEGDDSAKQLEAVEATPQNVEARPLVTARGGHQKRNQKKAQANWDKKFGDTHNPDGTPMLMSSDGVASNPSMNGASPSIPMNSSAQVENESDFITSLEKQSDQIVLSEALAGAIGSSNNTLPYQPEVSVNVTTPKTSLPNNNAELLFINSNVKHLV